MMECAILRDRDPRWDEFVTAHPSGTFFHLSAWREILKYSFAYEPIYLIAEDAQRLCGVLPLVLVKSWLFGRSLVAMPVGVYGGILASSDQAGRKLLDEAMRLAKQHRVRYLSFAATRSASLRLKQILTAPHPAGRARILMSPLSAKSSQIDEANLARIPRKQRRMVRQGESSA
jgi:hypothetical protein